MSKNRLTIKNIRTNFVRSSKLDSISNSWRRIIFWKEDRWIGICCTFSAENNTIVKRNSCPLIHAIINWFVSNSLNIYRTASFVLLQCKISNRITINFIFDSVSGGALIIINNCNWWLIDLTIVINDTNIVTYLRARL